VTAELLALAVEQAAAEEATAEQDEEQEEEQDEELGEEEHEEYKVEEDQWEGGVEEEGGSQYAYPSQKHILSRKGPVAASPCKGMGQWH
jgi:hypothetical protein